VIGPKEAFKGFYNSQNAFKNFGVFFKSSFAGFDRFLNGFFATTTTDCNPHGGRHGKLEIVKELALLRGAEYPPTKSRRQWYR
jgi:hypothetical protein